MKRILFLLLFLLGGSVYSQGKYTIVDTQKEEIPFVQCSDSHRKTIADINGKVDLQNFESQVSFKCFGYKDTIVTIRDVKNDTIVMTESAFSLNEITIHPGENPAIRIIRNASSHRKANAPNANLPYQIETYSKFVFSLDSLFDKNQVNITKDSLYQRLSRNKKESVMEKDNTVTLSDTSASDSLLNRFLKQSHLMIMESASTKEFTPPFRENEIIHAYKISGIHLPELANFANTIQSFSFYENTFDLLGSSYLNPIAFGADKRYAYILEDSIIRSGGDTTFVIRFFPKPNKFFDALYGTLFINSNQWAIEKVIAQPIPNKNQYFFVKIVQDYEWIQDKKWFPVNLITELYTPNLNLNGRMLSGKGVTHISNIRFERTNEKKRNNGIVLETASDASKVAASEWDEKRYQPLTEKEKSTYIKIDSIGKEAKIERKLNALSYLLRGKIPMRYVNLDLTKVIDFNLYEGYRLGMGLETSNLVSKVVTVGGYFAYGTYDRLWKYGGSLDFLLHSRNDVHLNISYHQDLIDRGMQHFDSQPYQFTFNSYYADFYTSHKDKQQDIRLLMYGKVAPNLQLGVSFAFEDIHLSDDYRFILPPSTFISKLQQWNLSSEILWTPGAKWSLIENRFFKLENKYPEIRFKATKTFSTFDYWRFKLDIYQQNKIFRVGEINWLLSATKTIGNVPLFALNTPNATGGNFNLSIPNSFETMLPGTYYSSQYIAMFLRYTTNSWRTRLKFFRPSLSLHQAMGIGNMNRTNNHSNELTFRTMDKGYFETGVVLNKVIYLANIGIGMGVFYHYGADTYPEFGKNLTYKISLLFELK